MSDEMTLLPCPFCGGEARLVNDYSSEKGMSYQIWHECTGHEGRSGGYGQGVKPVFETPWYATDVEAITAWNTRTDYHGYEQAAIEAWKSIKAWNTRATHGTLTAEQVREAVEASTWAETSTIREFNDSSWQAIADELNAELGSGTCEVECFDDGVDEGLDGEWFSYAPPTWYLSCGHTAQGTERPNFCPMCGKAVKR